MHQRHFIRKFILEHFNCYHKCQETDILSIFNSTVHILSVTVCLIRILIVSLYQHLLLCHVASTAYYFDRVAEANYFQYVRNSILNL
jgi:hypothetical protein